MPINDLANHVLHGRHNYYYKKAEVRTHKSVLSVCGCVFDVSCSV